MVVAESILALACLLSSAAVSFAGMRRAGVIRSAARRLLAFQATFAVLMIPLAIALAWALSEHRRWLVVVVALAFVGSAVGSISGAIASGYVRLRDERAVPATGVGPLALRSTTLVGFALIVLLMLATSVWAQLKDDESLGLLTALGTAGTVIALGIYVHRVDSRRSSTE